MEGLIAYAASLGFWSWLVLGLILFALETIIPGVHFLWFGVAAMIIGVITAALGAAGLGEAFSFPWQMVAFASLSVLTVFAVKRVAGDARDNKTPDINAPGSQFIGRNVVVEEAIRNGRGKVRAGDSVWLAEGEDAAQGARVLVTGVNGTALVVTTDLDED